MFDFFKLLCIYLLEQDVLDSCLESSFWQIQIVPLTFSSLTYLLFFFQPVTSLLKASISVHLPVISRSGLSQVIYELCWPPSANRTPSCHAFMQVPHTSCVSVRAWPKEPLLLLLLLFKGLSHSCGTLLIWILTASLVPAGLQDVWVLNYLKVTFILLFFFCWRLARWPHWVHKGSCHRLSTGRRFFRLPSLNPHRKTAKQVVLLSCAKLYRIWVLHL